MLDIQLFVEKFNYNQFPLAKREWELLYSNAIVHTRGAYPKRIMEEKRTLPKEILEYRKLMYEPLTTDIIHRATDSISRAMYQSDYKLSIEDFNNHFYYENDETNIEKFHFETCLNASLEDANAVLYWMPDKDVDEQLINEKVQVQPIIVYCNKIKYIDSETFVHYNGTIELESRINRGLKSVDVYRLVTSGFIYDLIPYLDSKDEVKYDYKLYYQTDIETAFKILGGRKSFKIEKGVKYVYNISYFSNIFAWGNEFIAIYSDFKPIFDRMSSPIIQLKAGQCPEPHCRNGIIVKEDCENTTCQTCKGKGVITDFTPYSTLLMPEQRLGETADTSDAIRYIIPPVDAVESAKRTAFEYYQLLQNSANITRTDITQSGVAKDIDRQQKYDQLSVIINNIFDIISFSCDSIVSLLNPNIKDVDSKYILVYPQRINIQSETELQEMANNKSLPVSIQKQNIIEYIEKKYSTDVRARELQKYIVLKDAYYTYSSAELQQLKSASLTDDNALKIHMYINEIVLKLKLDDYTYDSIDNAFMSELDNIPDLNVNPILL
jgi:hypothetical protein